MYAKIENNIITSYSKTEMEWWIYTTTKLLSAWMIVTAINWDEIIANLPVNKEQEIIEKIRRMEQINKNLLQLWGTNKLTAYTNFNTIRSAKITKLETEFNNIESDLLANYSDTMVDDILVSLFA